MWKTFQEKLNREIFEPGLLENVMQVLNRQTPTFSKLEKSDRVPPDLKSKWLREPD